MTTWNDREFMAADIIVNMLQRKGIDAEHVGVRGMVKANVEGGQYLIEILYTPDEGKLKDVKEKALY